CSWTSTKPRVGRADGSRSVRSACFAGRTVPSDRRQRATLQHKRLLHLAPAKRRERLPGRTRRPAERVRLQRLLLERLVGATSGGTRASQTEDFARDRSRWFSRRPTASLASRARCGHAIQI